MLNISDIIIYFMIYSFLGWLLESIVASIRAKKFINRGFLYGFICPIYGYGATIVIFSSGLVFRYVGNYASYAFIINIAISIILVTALEYITGYVMEKIFKCKWWDYSNHAWNLHGYICLQTSILWGVLAFILLQFLHPEFSEIVNAIPNNLKKYISLFLFTYLLIDTIMSMISTLQLRKIIILQTNYSAKRYTESIKKYSRIFRAFPHLLSLNANNAQRHIRGTLREKVERIKNSNKK